MSTFKVEPDLLERYALLAMENGHLDEVLSIERMSYSNPWSRDAFVHEIEGNPLSCPRVAVCVRGPTEVAGYCITWVVFERLHIQNVAVHPRHRRVGLAGLLLRRALEDGEERGAIIADLEVRRSNLVALKLYQSLGFELAGGRRDYYSKPREDAVLLRKDLRR